MHRHRKFHRTYPQNRHLSTVYDSTIEQLQEQVASLKKSSENGSDQLRALREETIQITRRQKREAEDLIRTLQSQVMETLKQFPAQDSTLQHQVREQELAQIRAYANSFKEQIKLLLQQRAEITEEQRDTGCDYVIEPGAMTNEPADGHYTVSQINGDCEQLPA